MTPQRTSQRPESVIERIQKTINTEHNNLETSSVSLRPELVRYQGRNSSLSMVMKPLRPPNVDGGLVVSAKPRVQRDRIKEVEAAFQGEIKELNDKVAQQENMINALKR